MEIKDIKNINDLNKVIADYLESGGFTRRKLTDTPTDNFQVVPRKYVNLNGTVALRPNRSVAVMGQKYFATDLNQLMVFNSTTLKWYNGVASVVA